MRRAGGEVLVGKVIAHRTGDVMDDSSMRDLLRIQLQVIPDNEKQQWTQLTC